MSALVLEQAESEVGSDLALDQHTGAAALVESGAASGVESGTEEGAGEGAGDAARAAARALTQAAGIDAYGSFFLGQQEFALAAACIREVVELPARIHPIPLSPACLEGIFTLRGAAIPLLNLARMFDATAAAAHSGQKIAVIDYEGIQIGLLIDASGEVLRVRPEQRSSVDYAPGHPHAVISGAILLAEGKRLLQVLDPAVLIRIDNVPQLRAHGAALRSAERQRFLRHAEGRKCITFSAAGLAFALGMDAIQEIICVPELKPSAMAGRLCKGWMNFRGSALGVVDFGALLHCADAAGAADDQRILVLRLGQQLLGLLVDSVDDVRPYFDGDILPLPLLGTRRGAMLRGFLADPDKGEALFLEHTQILQEAEVAELCAGHTRLYQDQADQDASGVQSRARAAVRQTYLVFGLDSGWAADITQVREILPCDGTLTRPPGMPDCVYGMLPLRQQMICVVDLRTLYAMAPVAAQARAARRILVLERGSERYGVIVDRVDSILLLPDSARRASPRLLRANAPQDMRRELDEVLELADHQVLSLFDSARFFTTLAQQSAA